MCLILLNLDCLLNVLNLHLCTPWPDFMILNSVSVYDLKQLFIVYQSICFPIPIILLHCVFLNVPALFADSTRISIPYNGSAGVLLSLRSATQCLQLCVQGCNWGPLDHCFRCASQDQQTCLAVLSSRLWQGIVYKDWWTFPAVLSSRHCLQGLVDLFCSSVFMALTSTFVCKDWSFLQLCLQGFDCKPTHHVQILLDFFFSSVFKALTVNQHIMHKYC